MLAVIPNASLLVTAAIALRGFVPLDGFEQFLHILATHNGRIGHWPLSGSANAIVDATLIRVIASIGVGKKQGVKTSSLKNLGQVNPIFEIPLVSRSIIWVLMESAQVVS